MIQFEHVSKCYAKGRDKALDDLTLHVGKGKVFGFIGPNGAGKTTTIKLLTAYDQMSRQGVSGENITGTMEKVEGMMSSIVQAFEKQLDSLFGDEAMDISTDITVLENMMVREGLAADDLHWTAQSESQTQPPQGTDGGITLEL